MPVYIGDVLEASGGPVLDLSTRQVKGLGFFSSTEQRDDLDENLRIDGYISNVEGKLEVYDPYDFSIPSLWTSNFSWKNFLINRGFAFDLAYDASGNRDGINDVGFLLGDNGALVENGQFPLKAGDIFHIRGIDRGNFNGPRSGNHYGSIIDGSYLVLNDVNVSVAPNGTDVQIKLAIEAIHDDHMGSGGSIVALHPSRTSVSKHISLTDTNISAYTPYENLAEALLSNDNGKLLVGFDSSENQASQDFSLTFSDFISVLTAGIAEDLVDQGYGDYSSYGGVAGTTYSAGDIDGDGLVTVADLLILLGNFGEAVEPTFDPTIVSFTEVYGGGALSPLVEFDEDLYLFDQDSSTRTFMYKDWGTYGTAPTVQQGGATTYIINSTNSLTDLDSISNPPGDMVVFAETPSNDFFINAFGNNQLNQARIEIRESNNLGVLDLEDGPYFRNYIQVTDSQLAYNMTFSLVAKVRRFSSADQLPNITVNVIDEQEIILQNLGSLNSIAPNNALFFNLVTGVTSTLGTASLSISDLYQNQTGSLIFQNASDGTPVKAVGVQVGYRFNNTLLNSAMSHPNVSINDFDIICYPPV